MKRCPGGWRPEVRKVRTQLIGATTAAVRNGVPGGCLAGGNPGAVLIERIGALAQFPEHAARAVANVVLQHLSAGLAGLGAHGAAIDATIAPGFLRAQAKPRILMTSGIWVRSDGNFMKHAASKT